MLDKETVAKIHMGRQVIYSFLSEVYATAPGDDFFISLNSLLPNISSMVGDDGSLITEGVKRANEFIEKRNSLKDEDLKEFDDKVCKDYNTLFSNISLLCGEVENIEKLYNHFSFAYDSDKAKNNISIELQFLSYLSSYSRDFLEKRDDKSYKIVTDSEIEFIEKELLTDVEKLIGELNLKSCADDFYLPISSMMFGFLKADVEFLKA